MMATYPGMNLRGEVRESVTLDEDDLSDVEDEVFIRDGKNGYKFEDISVKKPLMAPRRKTGRPDLGTRIKNRPACKSICKVCCYAFVALSIIIGLIVIVIVLVSLFPLPLDKLKLWIISKTNDESIKLTPCSDFKVTDVWSVNFPNLISESSVQILDINQDGVDDIIFGFGTGEETRLPQDLYCAIFFGRSPPCNGGVLALNGSNGNVLWKNWLHHSVFTIICAVDINSDNISDCLITGKGGIFSIIDPKNGSVIWEFVDKTKDSNLKMDIYSANFIPDQDNDKIPDILVSHTSLNAHFYLISGKSGVQIQQVAMDGEIYTSPQLLENTDGNYSVLFGTGSPTVPGNLSVTPLRDLLSGQLAPKTLYQDLFKGVLSPSILVDITGDGVMDIICALYNTTVVAINGDNFTQIWNYTIANSQTLSIPTPGYFNGDNVTDFLIKYQTGTDFPTYYFSQTFILNGKTGKPIYTTPVIDSAGSQMGGLTLSMEGFGFDAFVYWVADCKNFEGHQSIFEFIPGSSVYQQSRAETCRLRFNTSMVAKLYVLNQFDQPPGIEIYNSEKRMDLEYNNTKLPMDVVKRYLSQHPEIQFELPETSSRFMDDYEQNQDIKYTGGSSFRHKDNGQGLIRDFTRAETKRRKNPEQVRQKFVPDYETPENWQSKISTFPIDDLATDYNAYLDDQDTSPSNEYNTKKLILQGSNNRDPRSKFVTTMGPNPSTPSVDELTTRSSDDTKYGIYDYKNIQRAHTRLLHDLNDLPNEILKDTYFKNREHQLRKSRFEQRDLKSHEERIKESEDVRNTIEAEKKASINLSETLWDLESEKELQDRDTSNWRSKREIDYSTIGIPRLTSVGALASSLNSSKNSIDLILVTYWVRPEKGAQVLLEEDFRCINEKLKINSKDGMQRVDKETLEELFMKECLEKRGVILKIHTNSNIVLNNDLRNFPYFNQVSELSFGQMTVYRLQIECVCSAKKGKRCAKFLRNQPWPTYLGKLGDGVFKTRN